MTFGFNACLMALTGIHALVPSSYQQNNNTTNKARNNCLGLCASFWHCSHTGACAVLGSILGAAVSQSMSADVMSACADDSGRPVNAESERTAAAGWQLPGCAPDAARLGAQLHWRPLYTAGAGALHALRGRGAATDGAAPFGGAAQGSPPAVELAGCKCCAWTGRSCVTHLDFGLQGMVASYLWCNLLQGLGLQGMAAYRSHCSFCEHARL